ncbi:MAG: NAD(P)H-hydrate dehydratase [Candidatus Altiarchaeota archaeon]
MALSSKAIDMNARWLGVTTLQLMENAGAVVAKHGSDCKKIAIFCGTGNNGGDGFVAARHLAGLGKKITVYSLRGERTNDAQHNLDILNKLSSIKISYVYDSAQSSEIKGEIKDCDCVIDALIGVGISGNLREPVRSLVSVINSFKGKKIAVDIPTGGDDVSVKADITISFHSSKIKDAVVADIGIPKEAETHCGPGDVWEALPKRTGFEHKGEFGRLLIVGGSKRYWGTPALVGQAALRSGCDLVTIATPKYCADKLTNDPTLMVYPLGSSEFVSEDDVDKILALPYDALVIGNGLAREKETKKAVDKLIKKADKPIVFDADALHLIDKKDLKENHILTPHFGEFLALFSEEKKQEDSLGGYWAQTEKEPPLEDRVGLVKKYSEKIPATIVLKGAVDLIGCKGEVRFNNTGNPSMTVGGTGDVLAGVIGGLLAQNKDTKKSAYAGAFLTGLAGDLAETELGIGLTAKDVIEKIPQAIKESCSYA